MNAATKQRLQDAIWRGSDGKILMSRAYTYCMGRINNGMNRCNKAIPLGDYYCSTCQASRATPKVNSVNSATQGGEKGISFPSTSCEVAALEPPRKGIYYEELGPAISEKLIREAHGLKCVNCGEPIGELSDAVTNYGWVHYPEGQSYTYCFPEQNQIDLRAQPKAKEVDTD